MLDFSQEWDIERRCTMANMLITDDMLIAELDSNAYWANLAGDADAAAAWAKAAEYARLAKQYGEEGL